MVSNVESLYRTLMVQGNYLAVRRELVKVLGGNRAVFLTEMIRKEEEISQSGELPEDRSFYFLAEEVWDRIGYSRDLVTDSVRDLTRRGILTVNRRGMPARSYYTVHYDKVVSLLREIPDKDAGNSGILMRENVEPLPKRRTNEEEPMKNRSRGAEAPPAPGGKKVGVLRKEVAEMIVEATVLGEFRSKPPEPGKPALRWHLDVQKFLTAITDPRVFARAYELDPEWLKRSGIDIRWLEGKDVGSLVRGAASAFATMRREGYEPQRKAVLTPYLQTFFYNQATRKSWFLYCVFNEPRAVAGGRGRDVEVSEEEREIMLRHLPEGWPEQEYLAKAKNLLAWYRGASADLRLYNYYVEEMTSWRERFSSFERLLRTLDEFSETWSGWNIGNFGHGNRTWSKFVDWCDERYGVRLEPTAEGLRRARTWWERERKQSAEQEDELRTEKEDLDERAEAFKKELMEE